MSIYRILDESARSWWYHRDLRKAGNTREARKRERFSIRGHVRDLRRARDDGGYLSVGRGGWSLHYPNGTLSHYGGLDEPIPRCALALGIPVVDTTTIPDSKVYETITIPLAAIGREPDPAPWGSCSYAPLTEVARRKAALGATLYNFEGVSS
jgi:hypothetical protein